MPRWPTSCQPVNDEDRGRRIAATIAPQVKHDPISILNEFERAMEDGGRGRNRGQFDQFDQRRAVGVSSNGSYAGTRSPHCGRVCRRPTAALLFRLQVVVQGQLEMAKHQLHRRLQLGEVHRIDRVGSPAESAAGGTQRGHPSVRPVVPLDPIRKQLRDLSQRRGGNHGEMLRPARRGMQSAYICRIPVKRARSSSVRIRYTTRETSTDSDRRVCTPSTSSRVPATRSAPSSAPPNTPSSLRVVCRRPELGDAELAVVVDQAQRVPGLLAVCHGALSG